MDPPREPNISAFPLPPVPKELNPTGPAQLHAGTPGAASTATLSAEPVDDRSPPSEKKAAAAAHIHHARPTAEELKKLQHRIDLRLVPICATLYLLCFLCRQNIGNAKTFHMTKDLDITNAQYQLALTAFFFTYASLDIPCNIVMRKIGPKIWLPLITALSGVVTAAMGTVQGYSALVGVRAVLGATECGLFPGVAMLITTWYVKKEAQYRQALFFCAASMAGAFAGLLAIILNKMDGIGGYEGWRWILIMEGVLTVAIALAAFFLVQSSPAHAKFLTERERDIITHRLRNDEFGIKEVLSNDPEPAVDAAADADEDYIRTKLDLYRRGLQHSNSRVLHLVFAKWHMYAHIFVFWGISAPLYSISLCLPTILAQIFDGAAPDPTKANLLTIPIYITACLLSLGVAAAADRAGRRAPFIAGAYTLMLLGFVIAVARPASAPGAAYAGVFIAACGIYPAFPGMITWCANNVGGGERVRAVAIAFHIGMGSFGGAMGANFYSDRTRGSEGLYRLGHGLNILFVGLGAVAVGLLWWRYHAVNVRRGVKRDERRRELEEQIVAEREAWRAEKGEGAEGWALREREMRREFELKRQMDLVEHGEESVWFEYTT